MFLQTFGVGYIMFFAHSGRHDSVPAYRRNTAAGRCGVGVELPRSEGGYLRGTGAGRDLPSVRGGGGGVCGTHRVEIRNKRLHAGGRSRWRGVGGDAGCGAGAGNLRRRPHECGQRRTDHQPDDCDHPSDGRLGSQPKASADILRCRGGMRARRLSARVGNRSARAPHRRHPDACGRARARSACHAPWPAHRRPKHSTPAADHSPDPGRSGPVRCGRHCADADNCPHRSPDVGGC